MKLRDILSVLACTLLAIITPCFATTIIPFTNYGEMARASELVVLVTAQENFSTVENGTTRFRTRFIVRETIKGIHGPSLVVQNHRLQIDSLERQVWGDVTFEEGETYLLCLRMLQSGVWQTLTLSHGVFQEERHAASSLLIPVAQGLEIHLEHRPDGQAVEPFGVYETAPLLAHLREVVNGEKEWNSSSFLSDYQPESTVHSRNTPPSHCSFISGTPYARWQNPDTQDLPVRYTNSGDPDCALAPAYIQSAISNMNLAYSGIRLVNALTHDFVPSCSGGDGASGSEFVSYLNNNLGGGRNILIQFDDPCDEIQNLNGCSGTLAFGGLYWSGSTYTEDGNTWRRALYGYVYLNEGVGNCYCTPSSTGFNYVQLITHELTHALNLGHISAGVGVANMNTTCCNDIRDLDIQCVEYLYPPAPQPVSLVSFNGQQKLDNIELSWITESEINSDYFVLERSEDGQHFRPLATLPAAGSSNQLLTYTHMDPDPQTGTNYYRLVQYDYDGSNEQLSTIAVSYFGEQVFRLSPNPLVGNQIELEWAFPRTAPTQLRIFNAQGQRVYQSALPTEAEVLERSRLELPELVPGIYFAQASQGDAMAQLRFIVQ